MSGSLSIVDFNKASSLDGWAIVDDVVMGGRSAGEMYINQDGNAVFEGEVSLENNGGFSSVRYSFQKLDVVGYSKLEIHLKGDGKRYQFRVKSSRTERHSYITYFQSTGEWQTVEIQLSEMLPSWRGRDLDLPAYPGLQMEELAFLIGNQKAESFRLEIDSIVLK